MLLNTYAIDPIAVIVQNLSIPDHQCFIEVKTAVQCEVDARYVILYLL